MDDNVFGTLEAATANLRPYCDVFKVTNPHRATLYVVGHSVYDALTDAAQEWGITAEVVSNV